MISILWDWQTLIAGLLALAGAWWTISTMNRQAAEGAERKRRRARAMLPATLMAVHDYVLESVRWLESVREKGGLAERGQYAGQPIPVPTVPRPHQGLIDDLIECVEHLDIAQARWVSDLLSKIQVQQARIASLHDYFVNPPPRGRSRAGIGRDIDGFMVDSVRILAFSNQLFPFARLETHLPPQPPGFNEVVSAFHACHLEDTADVNVYNALTNPFMPKPVYFQDGAGGERSV